MKKNTKNLIASVTITAITLGGLILPEVTSAATQPEKEAAGRSAIEKARLRAFYSGKDRVATGHMTVEQANGVIRNRDYTVLRRDEKAGGDQSYFIHFTKPSDMADTTFLVKKHVKPTVDDDRWLYLPKLNLVRRIAAGDKRTHFVGTDLFYEDVSGRHIDDDVHELVEEDAKYWVVKSTPKDSSTTEFTAYKTWIHKKTHLNIKVEYYKEADTKYRVCKILKVRNVDGFPTPISGEVLDLETGSKTTSNLLSIKYNAGIPEDIFETRYLSNPPMNWLSGEASK